jgi:hypothetical protein
MIQNVVVVVVRAAAAATTTTIFYPSTVLSVFKLSDTSAKVCTITMFIIVNLQLMFHIEFIIVCFDT